jgi:glycosyltransferase involved in cell wall biosynthesis
MAILDGIWTRSYGDALSDADCDIYIQVCAGRATGYVGDFCRREEKPFIFRATSIWDADVTFTSGQRTWRRYSKLCYLRGLRATNIIACNSLNTMRAFGKHFEGQRLRLLRDGFDVSQTVGSHSGEGFILWVGRDAWYKHPQLFLSLAEMLPKYRFVMVGNIRSLRNCPPNLELVGQKPPGEIGKLYSEASIVVNTSEVEGFPNVLVEAGQWRLPYVAFFDPDDVITHEELGINPKSVEEMAESIKKLMGDEKERERLGANGRRFVEREFGIERAADKWIQVFRELTGD